MSVDRLSVLPLMLVASSLLGTGCTTEVVDFPIHQQAVDAALSDALPANCVLKVSTAKRCIFCKSATTGVITELTCEELACKYQPFDAGGGCKLCWWIDHPKEACTICTDAKGKLKKDTCHGADGGA